MHAANNDAVTSLIVGHYHIDRETPLRSKYIKYYTYKIYKAQLHKIGLQESQQNVSGHTL